MPNPYECFTPWRRVANGRLTPPANPREKTTTGYSYARVSRGRHDGIDTL